MSDVSIDWSTAEVTVSRATLTLEVALTEDADSFWTNEFTRLRDRRMREARRESWAASTPSFGKLIVSGVQPGSEEAVKQALDQMVEQANIAAVKARRQAEERQRTQEDEAVAREEAAREMTERFRSE